MFASDFPTENRRAQTRNFSYAKPLALMLEQVCGIKKASLFFCFFLSFKKVKTEKTMLPNFEKHAV
ncbi:hypothetical protein BWR22_05215 [Lacinutrix venerupis]|uniref:Uncharacterized protein n=1 Tax=Lacinutrix venerupis TaxID=1486034 RepID=A0AAC9LLE8_9FLAO|nr:hypothetical protein BWR22_05215 [Lacinutrix venerupis]